MPNTIRILLATFAILLPAIPPAARSADIEKLLMPGELVEKHADLESECSNCHVRFSKGTQTRLCLDCHEDVDADVAAGSGFHGRLPGTGDSACKTCHADHLGREADIVHLDPLTFDHMKTDFRLEGRHTRVACSSCHEAGARYAEAPSACHDCHGKRDPHDGNLGEQCDNCHTPKTWNTFTFDHERTEFPLHGTHRDIGCSTCHAGERYENTPKSCNGCHAIDDVHNGNNGTWCSDCHNERKWGETSFRHDRDTEFALRGRHIDAPCEACHTDPVKDKKPDSDCYSCHRSDDAHHGRYGNDCRNCHNETAWTTSRFDHARSTDFELLGGHADLACGACHRGEIHSQELSVDCISCHLDDDVHRGQEGEQCQRCHRESGWGESIVFDHGLTRFPLIGLHATVPCEECHISRAFRDASRDCIGCHERDDEHNATLGSECHSCHNPNSWSVWQFEHDRQTGFELRGVHRDLHCSDCHKRPTEGAVSQSQQCSACHRQDDIHQGRFGSDCARCHTNESFRDVRINY